MKTIKQIFITAIVAALVSGVGVPYAKQHLINGKQIKKGTITGKQVRFPAARPLSGARAARASAVAHTSVTDRYTPVAVLGSYEKLDAQSVLRIDWGGVLSAQQNACVFQVRVDGLPGDGNEIYVPGGPQQYTVSSLFTGLGAGSHEVSLYARVLDYAGGDFACNVNPRPGVTVTPATATEEVR